MAITDTSGRRPHSTPARPSEAATPTAAAVSLLPASSTTVPGRMSSPLRRMSLPAGTGSCRRTCPSCALTRSIGTTASVPAGTTAPVEMIAACDGPTGSLIGCPARDSPTTASVTGASSRAPTRSSLRTAKPSIAELSKGGTAASLRSSLRQHPPERVVERDRFLTQRERALQHQLARTVYLEQRGGGHLDESV